MANRKARRRFAKIEAGLELLGGEAPPAGSAMAKLEALRRGDPAMKGTIQPNMRKEKGELIRVSIPIAPFNKGMSTIALTDAQIAAKFYVKTAITRNAHALIVQCTTITEAQLGWTFSGGALSGISEEDMKKALSPNPTFLPAVLFPSYRRTDDQGNSTPSRFYTGQSYRKYDKRAGQIPFGKQDLELPTGYDPEKHSEEGCKKRILDLLKKPRAEFRAGSCGYDSEEFSLAEGGNFPWLDFSTPGIDPPFA